MDARCTCPSELQTARRLTRCRSPQVLTAIELARNARIAANRAYLGALLGPGGPLIGVGGAQRPAAPGAGPACEAEPSCLADPAGLEGTGCPPKPLAPVLAPDDPLVLVAARELARKAALAEALTQVCTAPLSSFCLSHVSFTCGRPAQESF